MAGLTAAQKQQYEEQGFVVFERLFEPEELQPVIAELDESVDRLARKYHAEGRITSLCEGAGFATRFLELCRQNEAMYNELTGSQHFRAGDVRSAQASQAGGHCRGHRRP